jgi:acetyl esterase/lipase
MRAKLFCASLCVALSVMVCVAQRPPRPNAATSSEKQGAQARQQTQAVAAPVPANTGTYMFEQVKSNVAYCGRASAQQMDIYFPTKAARGPAPALLYVHGGGWRTGDKSEGSKAQIHELIARGYLVAAINYRLFYGDAPSVPHNKFPAQIEDVKCAVRYLRAHSSELHIDPQRFGAWGFSAGGHLAALLGTSDDSDWTPGTQPSISSRIQAVVDMYGPTDLAAPGYCDHPTCQDIFNQSENDRRLASPVHYVTPDDPPFLIIQGDKDTLVPPSQSQELFEKLHAKGVEAKLVMVTNAGHMLKPSPPNAQINPTAQQVVQMVADFFDQHLNH